MSAARILVVHPPVSVARDFIDYPYFADLGAVQSTAVLRAAGHDAALVDALALPESGLAWRDDGRAHLGASVNERAAALRRDEGARHDRERERRERRAARGRAQGGLESPSRTRESHPMTSLSRISAGFALIGALVLAPGCGDDDAPMSDAGSDAGVAPMDAGAGFDAARPDAGTRECVGTPTECATLTTATCDTVVGCQITQCVGFAIACAMRSRDECMAGGTGCMWTGSACEGAATRCADVTDEAVCRTNTGCTWDPSTTCRGAPVACDTFSRDACTTQPGCMIYVPPHDAGPELPDAGCGTFDAGTGMVDIDVRIVKGPSPVTPAMGARVRVESLCGGNMEADVGADGVVHFSLPREAGQWDLTAALAGHNAMSLVDVTNFALTGDIRLDPLVRPDDLPHAVSGTLGGSVGVGNTVQIDAFLFETIMSASATWSSMYASGPWSMPQPLFFTAIEMDSMGRAVNVATTEVPRSGADITGVTLDLPTPRVAPTTSTWLVHLPAVGMVTTAGATPRGAFAERLSTIDDGEYVWTGTAQIALVGADVQVTVQHFPGVVDTNFAGATIDGTGGRLNTYKSDPAAGGDVTVGPGTITMLGRSLADLEVDAAGVSGHDAVVIHIGETDMQSPRWRVFAPTLLPVTRVPNLPSTVSLIDIGLTPASSTSVLALLIKMESGHIWSTRNANAGVEGYQYSIAGMYQTFSTSGR